MIPSVSPFRSPGIAVAPLATPAAEALRSKAAELETGFLAEMLRHSGFCRPSESFGGGAGEEQFSSFLVKEYARAFVGRGGIGLAEQFYKAMKGPVDAGG